MGIPAQSLSRTTLHRENGAALLFAIFGLVLIGVVVVGGSFMSGSVLQTGSQRVRTTRALQVSESGAAHALALLRGPLATTNHAALLRGADGLPNTADDGVLSGFGLTTAQHIPTAGVTAYGGTYSVRVIDDPADGDANAMTDLNNRVLVRCTGTLADGSTASVDVMVGQNSLPGIVVDGNLHVPGNPTLAGACGGAHSNGNLTISGVPTVQTYFSSSGSVGVSGTINYSSGTPLGPYANRPQVDVPTLAYGTYCPSTADYVLQTNGRVRRISDMAELGTSGSGWGGWKRSSTSPLIWETTTNTPTLNGTVCVQGNAKISNDVGSAASAYPLTLITQGSIELSGNPYVAADAGQPILFLAEGDLKINGNPTAGSVSFGGALYALSQCHIGGNPTINGQVICKNLPDGPGDVDLFDDNQVNGNPDVTYGCNGMFGGTRILAGWWPRFG